MGRTATGVKGIELDKKDHVIDMVVVRRKSTLLTVTEKGMGSAPSSTSTGCSIAAAAASSR